VIAALLLAAAAARSDDACTLLTRAEIRRVQGEEPQEAKASERQAGGLAVRQCFYALPDFSRSVSLELTRGPTVRELWREHFAKEEHAAPKDREAGEEEDEERPERVRGIGEEAFWTGNPRLGGLYVLRKDSMLRLSVGGNDPKAKKLRRLTALARLALRRM
jgi:hypothetical protein